MGRVLAYMLYILALAIEILRVLLFTYIEKAQPWPLSIVDWIAFVFLCMPAVFFFLLLHQEKDFHQLLRIIAGIKFLSIIAAWFFFDKNCAFCKPYGLDCRCVYFTDTSNKVVFVY
ncbi:hypothetical protein HMPREF9721_00191 [Treponema denticola ATCC 35404]|nr:hypothetical protein HMPREF9735_01642 [Treponema denticola ATCC 33521]EMB41447.1 hypothetical protein HMPREF9721_00191 [Treponema denticola ATCC 35404]